MRSLFERTTTGPDPAMWELSWKSPPGRGEAEGFGVGIDDQEPTPAFRDRCQPTLQGISDGQRFTCKIRYYLGRSCADLARFGNQLLDQGSHRR